MKKPTLENLFILLGWKKGQTKPAKHTAQGKYCHLMWDNIDNPKVSVHNAMMWVAKRKDEIDTLFKD